MVIRLDVHQVELKSFLGVYHTVVNKFNLIKTKHIRANINNSTESNHED